MPQYSIAIIRIEKDNFQNKETDVLIGNYVCENHTEMMKAVEILTNVFNSTDIKWVIEQLEE